MTASTVFSTSPTASFSRIALVGILFSFVWSSAFIAGKIGMTSTGPLTLLSLRFLTAGAILIAFARYFGYKTPFFAGGGKVLLIALLGGLLSNAVYLGLTYKGMQTVPAGLTAILVSINPLLTSALAAMWLKEPFGWRGVLGLAAGFVGVLWIVGERATSALADVGGVTMILLGTMALAASTLLMRRVVGKLDPFSIALIQLPVSGLALLPIAWWQEALAIRPDAAFFGSLLYQATVVSIGTTLMVIWLVRHGGAARASSFHLLNPVFGTLLALGLLDEPIPPSDLLGMLPIVAGLALVLRPAKKSFA